LSGYSSDGRATTTIKKRKSGSKPAEGSTRRAIDLHEGDEIDEKALKGGFAPCIEHLPSRLAAGDDGIDEPARQAGVERRFAI